MSRTLRILLAAALLVPGAAALAHHSYAMFDMNKTITLQGTIIQFKWQNPHAFLQIDAAVKGQTERWALEMTSPNNLANDGFKRSSFKPGDKVTLRIHPLRDGSKGGSFLAAKLADGSTLGDWK
ncbi:MAG: DUF6152 family protein [Candidatus Andeanibacterium colombiense]|uniref:DUF6152 family protein n=1 Tax=Candidatus Andeanibacterium colombiense TaxID=3121345 RepID=A0AAJ5X1J0_9SPHN|nr:MAG: DUF6152 family protein [Sphingomonadaceae bacterium]